MANLDAKSLQSQLKSGNLSNLYYIYGSDTLAVSQTVQKILKAASGGETDAVTKLDGANLNVSTLADEAELCPMFAEYNCIWVHDLNMDTVREDVRKSVMEILKNVGSQTVLLFDVTGFDIYGGKTGKKRQPTDKNKRIIDYILKNGTVCICEPRSVNQCAADLIAAAKKAGCMMDRPAAVALATQCGCQSLLLRQEMGKLCAYAAGGEITEQMIRDMVTPQLETTVYALTNAIVRRKSRDAMRSVDELLAMRVEMQYLLATVGGSLLDVQRACAARQSGKNVQDMKADFGYRFDFMVENAFKSSMGDTLTHVSNCLKLLVDAEKRLHSGAVDERVLFEKTIVQMLRG